MNNRFLMQLIVIFWLKYYIFTSLYSLSYKESFNIWTLEAAWP